MGKEKVFNRLLDFFFVFGTILVLFTHFSKQYIPSFLFPFFGSDTVLSIYPFFIFSIIAIFFLLYKKGYKKLLFVLLMGLIFCFGHLVITEHGLLKIIDSVSEHDVENLDGSRLSFFNIVSRVFGDKDISFRLIISEGLFSLYAAFNQFKEVFLVVFLIGFSYKDRTEDIKKCLFIGLIISFALVVPYEIIEFPFLWGSEHSIEIQKKINPLLHEVNVDGGWWPPVIWFENVLRSVFAEPSFFGYYLGFTTVAFIHLLLYYKNKTIWAVLLFLSFLFGFLTNSRSGVMLVLGGTAVYCILYLIKERKIKGIIVVFFILAMAFAGNNLVEEIKKDHGIVTSSFYEEKKTDVVISPLDGNVFEIVKASFELGDVVKDAISDSSIVKTIKTVFSLSARSNVTRYGCTFAEISIGLDNPLLGVGDLYVDNYKAQALNDLGFSNYELSGWINKQSEKGVLSSTFASFNSFTSAFAEGGVVGIVLEIGLLFFLIFSYAVYFIKTIRMDINKISIMIISMLAVIFAWGFSNSFQENYLYVIVLGCSLADLLSSWRLLKYGKTNV